MNGVFITFEGNEGSGKSTQIERLAKRLRLQGRRVLCLREPGGTAIGEEIRHTLKHSAQNHAMTSEAELLLMSASRAQLVREVIKPALADGQIVLCDRFYDSSIVYQGYGRGLDRKWIATLTAFVVGPVKPNLTLLLQVPLAVSLARRQTREQEATTKTRDRFEEADEAFFAKIDTGYRELAKREPERIRVIDGTLSAEAVETVVWMMVEPAFRKR
jgi:dTMP kinase